MSRIAAPSAKAMLSQATAAWPSRSCVSDGIIPSAAHTAANPSSDHEMGAAGYCHAVDLTQDPSHGCDCGPISESLRISGDGRLKYVIFDRRIWNPRVYSEWRAYGGTNPHTGHMHVSVTDTLSACEDVRQWPGIPVAAPVAVDTPSPATVAVPTPTYPLIHKGCTGPNVSEAQRLLEVQGFPTVIADGEFGCITDAETRAFQRLAKIEIDGLIGEQTWGALRGPVLPRAKMPLVEFGARNQAVRDLQDALNKIIGAGLAVDGRFGAIVRKKRVDATGEAVERFQRLCGLKPDRVVGPITWRALGYF